jgi:riboflavin kinase
MTKFHSEEIFNLPDFLFSKFCEEKYDINKGVYNTIDRWFYEQGLSHIVNRRTMILSFCQNFCISGNKKVKFGPGGLTIKLNLFWAQHVQQFDHKAM